MLKIAHSMGQLSFSGLMDIYREGNLRKANYDEGESLLRAEQECYDYLSQVFFRTPGAVCAIWEEGCNYTCALRLEPYRDGLLLEALETAPSLRRRGYARKLIQGVQTYLAKNGTARLYSHVDKTNTASLRLHEGLGFHRISERAAYIDGSVDSRCCTLLWESKTAIPEAGNGGSV